MNLQNLSTHSAINRYIRCFPIRCFRVCFYSYPCDTQIHLSYCLKFQLSFVLDDVRMDYTIRDMIPTSMWPKMPNLPAKGFARQIRIRSQCREGFLVIDGGCAYQFNSGTTAILRTDPESILKTITLSNDCHL